jgi:import inner membrane translocase subunit TIM21
MLDTSKQLFKYLSGATIPPSPISPAPSLDSKVPQKESVGSWSFAGLFSGLRGLKGGPTAESLREAEGQAWTDGEVHADLIRNNDGYFVFRYLFIDIPSAYSISFPESGLTACCRFTVPKPATAGIRGANGRGERE